MTQTVIMFATENSMEKQPYQPKFRENLILCCIGVMAMLPLGYQLSRWRRGLDPTFVHSRWLEDSPFPLVLHLAQIHPVIWITIAIYAFWRICRNYGWRLERGVFM
jgi:hypothetical protein